MREGQHLWADRNGKNQIRRFPPDSRSFAAPVLCQDRLTRASLDLVRTIFPPAQSIRLVGVAVSNFDQPSAKAELPLFGADTPEIRL